MSIRPDLTGMTTAQVDYVEYLEKIALVLSNNGAVNFVSAINEQFTKLAEQTRGLDLDITSLKDKDDKTLERFLKMADVAPKLLASFKSFTQEYGATDKEDDQKSVPLVERMIRKNRNNDNKSTTGNQG